MRFSSFLLRIITDLEEQVWGASSGSKTSGDENANSANEVVENPENDALFLDIDL